MAKEFVTQADTVAGTLDKSGDISHNERLAVIGLYNAQNGSQGREVIVCNFGLCGGNNRNKG